MTEEKNPFAHLIAKPKTQSATPIQPVKLADPTPVDGLTSIFGAAPPKPEPVSPNKEIHTSSANELANIDTSALEPQKTPQTQLNLAVKAKTAAMVLESGKSVRELCDQFDKDMEANPQLVGPPLVAMRNYVQVLMVTLKEHPEFDTFVIDKDVHNIMRYVMATREQALELREVKTTKKAVRGAKKAVADVKNAGLESAFDAILGSFKL